MLEIPVVLGERRYAVSVGHGLARLLPDLLWAFRGRRIVLVAGRRVLALHGAAVERSLRGLGPAHVALVPDGERFKSRSTLARIHDAFLGTVSWADRTHHARHDGSHHRVGDQEFRPHSAAWDPGVQGRH